MKVFFVADDVGYSTRRDEGIFACVKNGCVRSVSLLVNGASAREAALMATSNGIDIGLHFNITEGKPVAPPAKIPSLLKENGMFLGKMELWEACWRNEVLVEHVLEEAKAQVQSFVELTGSYPRFFNGHNHVHVIPCIALSLADFLSTKPITHVRIPEGLLHPTSPHCKTESIEALNLSPFQLNIHDLGGKVCYSMRSIDCQARPIYIAKGLVVLDAFLGMSMSGKALTPVAVGAALDAISSRGMSHRNPVYLE
jgi:predicted glycoside hydrolase/deacetylase ChbG (UPF0249 family)